MLRILRRFAPFCVADIRLCRFAPFCVHCDVLRRTQNGAKRRKTAQIQNFKSLNVFSARTLFIQSGRSAGYWRLIVPLAQPIPVVKRK